MANISRAAGLGTRLLAFARMRLFAAFAGIAVAVVVMFIELGLLEGVLDSQAMVATLVRGDLVVLSASRTNLHKWNNVPQIRLSQAAGVEGVDHVIPVFEDNAGILDPADDSIRRIVVFAFPANELPLAIGDPRKVGETLRKPDSVLYDRLSRPIYGDALPGNTIQLDNRNYRVDGFVELGPDIVNDGAVIMSDGTWLDAHPRAQPAMGVVILKDGVDPQAVKARMTAQLPDDVSVFTPSEVRDREIRFTLRSAPIGILFGIGMLAGMVIGSITCYQILFNEIVDRLPQYATLKAMGFPDSFLRGIVLEQALLLSVGGFIVGMPLAWLAYGYVAERTSLAVRMDFYSVAVIFVMTVVMAAGAGWFALRRVAAADPADLY